MLSSLFTLSLPELVEAAGYAGIFAMVFAESGLPFGFIFPGDSLLFVAGLAAAAGYLSILPLLVAIVVAAILGDSTGYWIGAKLGPRIFTKEDSFLFSKLHIDRTQAFYEKYGPRAIIIARFLPVVRCFVPIFAGVGRMPYTTFLSYNVIGALIWGVGITSLAYFLGNAFPEIEHYLTYIIVAILALSMIPVALELLAALRKKKL